MNSRDYIITLILKARDEIAGAVGKALAEVEGLNKLAQKNGFKDLDADADRLSNTLRTKLGAALSEVRGNLNRTESDADKFERRYKSLGKTAEETGQKFKRFDIDEAGRKLRRAETDAKSAGDELERLGKRTNKNGDEWDRLSNKLEKANSRIDQHSSTLREAEKTAGELMKVTGQLSKLEDEHERSINRTRSAYEKQIESAAKLKVARDKLAMHPLDREKVDFKALDQEIDKEQRKAAELAAEVEALSKLHPTINIDLDKGHFDEQAAKVEAEKTIIGSDVHVNVDMDLGGAEAKLIAFEAEKKRATSGPSGGGPTSLMSWFRDVGQTAEDNSHSIAAFDNSLRGLAVLAVIAFAQPLLTVLTALGGELIAVASSAVMAGSALGGALVAGISQALPVAGVLVSTIARVGAVIAAVKQHELVRQQESYKGEEGEGSILSSEEGVVNATEAVTAARQNLRLAEIALTKARFEARRELQDLILQEKQAELAAKGAALSQFQAQMTLQEAIRSGSISEVAGAQLEVSSTRLSAEQARINASRARQDLHLQERGSPLGPNQGVPDAERQVEQSTKALLQSERAAKAALRAADEAANHNFAAAGKMNFMLAQLDASEKKLYTGARRLYQVYKEVTRPITDILVNSFTYATNKGVELLKNPQFAEAFESLAHSMAGNFKRITDEFNSPRWIKFFSTMTKEAGQNLGPLTTAFLSLSRAFRSIAEASAPVLHDIVEWIREGVHEFEQWVGKGKGLRSFFKEGEHALEAWLRLTGSIIKLFLALIGTSAKEGTSQIESLTDRINEATGYIEHHRKKVEAFFHEVGEVMSVLGQVLLALGAEILKAFNVNSVKDLGNVIIKVILPALGEAIRLFGRIATALSNIADNPAGGFMLKFVASVLILKAVISPFVSVLKGAVIQISKITTMVVGLGLAFSGVSAKVIATHGAFAVLKARLAGYSAEQIGAAEAGVPLMSSLEGVAAAGAGVSLSMLAIPAAIAAVAAAFIYLSDKFGVLDDEWNALKEVGEGIVKPILGPLHNLIHAVGELLASLGIVGGHAKGLGKVFEFVFIKLVKGGVIPAIKFFGSQFEFVAELIGGMLEGITGAVEILTGIFELNFDKIISGAKRLLGAFLTPFKAMFNDAKRIIGAGLDVIKGLLGDGLFNWLVRRAKSIPGLIGDAFHAIIGVFESLGKKALRGLVIGFEDVWDWFKKLPKRLGHMAAEGVSAIVHAFENLGSKILHAISGIADELVEAGEKIGEKLGQGLKQAVKNIPLLGKALELGGGAFNLAKEGVEFINPFADGGPVGQGVGTKDDQLAVLTRGEHVLTTEDVQNAGGHGAVFAWRRSLGSRGGQSRGGGYAEGGEVKTSSQEGQAAIGLEALLTMIINFGGEAIEAWDHIWDTLQHRTALGVKASSNKFDELEKSIIQSSKRINNQVVKSFNSTLDDVRGDVNQLTHVVFQGMDYIAEITEKALTAFGVKKVDLNIPKPKGLGGKGGKGKATGGFIGRQGERGADTEPTWLGRGEAVLNWAHQKVVEPAMHWYYGSGLNDMFRRTGGEHAAGGLAGYAKGRRGMSTEELFDGHPSGVAASLRKLIEIMKTKWPLLQVTATTDHSFLTSSGNVSDHTTGHAVDMATPYPSMASYMNKAARWVITSGLFKQIKQGIHNPDLAVNDGELVSGPGFYQGAWLEHLDHIHLAVFDALRGAFGGAGGLSKVPKMMVKGTQGPLKEMAQGVIDKISKAANKFIKSKMGAGLLGHGSQGTPQLFGHLVASPLQFARFMLEAGFPAIPKVIAEGLGTIKSESGFLVNNAQGPGGHIGPWAEEPSFGSVAEREDPRGSTFAAYKNWRANGGSFWQAWGQWEAEQSGLAGGGAKAYLSEFMSTAIQAIRQWKGRKGFASGGVIRELLNGLGGTGGAVPIFAHIGEWILNQRQQQRLAGMLGTSVDKLKGMLGFSGGPTSYAGGGEPKGEASEPEIGIGKGKPVTALPIPNLENYDEAIKYYLKQVNKELKRGAEGVDKKRKNLADFIAKLFTRIAKQLEEFKNGWEVLSQKLTIQLAKANVQLGKGGKILGRKLQPEQIISLEIKQLYLELGYLLSQQGPIIKALRLAQKALRKAKKEGDTKAEKAAEAAIKNFRNQLRENETAVAESRLQILEKREQRESEQVAKIGEMAERSASYLTNKASIASAMGFEDQADALTAAQVSVWEEEKLRLQRALEKAKQSNNQALAQQIEGEIEQLEVSVAEAAAALIQQAAEDIETKATRAKFGVELGNRMADVREHYGYLPQRQEERGVLLQQERGVLSTQMAESQALLAKAMAEGFGPDVIIPLQEKVEDLGVQLEENAAAIYANTIAVRQAYIEQIQERQSFIGGIYGTLETIITSLGAISGVVNAQKMAELIAAAGKQLVSTGEGLRDQFTAFVGERLAGTPYGEALMALSGLHGEELVNAIQNLDFQAIEEFLGPGSEAAKQFQALIQAILENEAAVLENTKQLEEILGQNQIQSFTSTAWQWFRRAIFTGMGGLMPEYSEGTPFYEAATGGEMTSDGPVHLHRGELIIPNHFSNILRSMARAGQLATSMGTGSIPSTPLGAALAGAWASSGSAELSSYTNGGMAAELSALREELARRTQHVETNVYEAEPSDPAYLSSRLAFAVKNPAT